jgi:hypothetical protein
MPHVVYMITFHRDLLPNKYIGSKSNAIVVEGKIRKNKKGDEYTGSSNCKLFQEAKTSCKYSLQILGEFDDYEDGLWAEHYSHIRYDVVASPEYFNKSIARVNNYANPEYTTYKHVATGKVARLPRNHHRVLSGEWVGVTKGHKLTEEHRKRIGDGERGERNGFYGKKHTEETKRISGKKIGDAHRGKPKSTEQRRKMAETRRAWWVARKADQARRETEGL